MSTPAVLERAPARPASLPEPTPGPQRGTRRRWPGLALVGIFLFASLYHALQSRGHATPAIFTDELLFEKLAQGLAAGDGLVVRGEPVLFPSPLPAFVQAPAWLLGDVADGYAAAKILNAILMSAAVFPAYWLARQLVRPAFALLCAAAAVAAPAMLYHGYLISEALAYPMFFLALAVMTRALATPSRGWGLAVIGVSLLAVTTRLQLAVLPLAYLVALALWHRRELRRHAVGASGLVCLAAAGLLSGGAALGPYLGAIHFEYAPLDILRLTALTAVLLPFAAGWLVAPGAALGFIRMLTRPQIAAQRAFATLALVAGGVMIAQAGVVSAIEAQPPLERYVIYLAPLVFVAFFVYVERGQGRRRVYVALALAAGLLAWLVPFPSLADLGFTFTSPVLSAYGRLATWLGHANAATILSGGAFAASLVAAAVKLRLRTAPLVAGGAVALLLATGVAAYSGDRAMTKRAVRAWVPSAPSWLDELGLARADYLALPGGGPHFGWTLEAWNRTPLRVIQLGVRDRLNESFAVSRAQIAGDGTLLVDGMPERAGVLILNDYATQIELEGQTVARPVAGLTAYRVPAAPRVRSLANGVHFDGWASDVRYQVWPEGIARDGSYRIVLDLPLGATYPPRTVTLRVDGGASRTLTLRAGGRATVELPATGYSVPVLRIEAGRSDLVGANTANPRLVSFRIVELEYVPSRGRETGEASLATYSP